MRRIAILVVALLAFVWQGFVTQTHEHFQPAAVSTLQIAKAGHYQATGGQPSRDDPANCPICQDIAHAGAYITPTPPAAVLATEAAAPSHVVPLSFALTVRERSHAWKSRAPPIQLQA